MADPRSVVVADDDPVYRAALCRAVGAEPGLRLVGTAADGRDALAVIERERPDVAALDVEMPLLSGPIVACRIRQLQIATRVLLLSDHHDEAGALGARGCGLVTKDAPLDAICRAILRVADGDVHVRVGIDATPRPPCRRPALTTREQAVLELAACGTTVAAIGRELRVSPASVKGHLTTLYAKLGASDRTTAVAEATRRGFVR